ncbi:MAG: phage tail tube protein [Proteobacteria bacterium]|nr:phage tail tube protein [Pseudomonadota bacterium]
MGKYTGRDIKIGISKESTRGVATPASYWIPRRDFDVQDKASIIIDDQSYGVIEDSVDARVVNKWSEGKISGLVRDKAIGLFLLNALGTSTPTTSSPESGVITHTFTVAQSHQHQSLTINVDDTIEGDEQYALAMLKTLEINATLNEFVIFNADFMAKQATPGTVTAAYVAENNFTADGVSLKIAATPGTLTAATATKVKSVSVKIDKALEKADILGTVTPDDFINKNISIEIDIERNYEDTTFKTLYMTASPQAMRVDIVSSAIIGLVSNPRLTFDFNQVNFTDWSVSKGLDDIVVEKLKCKAVFKIADAKMLEARLVNVATSY